MIAEIKETLLIKGRQKRTHSQNLQRTRQDVIAFIESCKTVCHCSLTFQLNTGTSNQFKLPMWFLQRLTTKGYDVLETKQRDNGYKNQNGISYE